MSISTWSVARSLIALGRNVKGTKPFTEAQLSQWASDAHTDFSIGAAGIALSRMRIQNWVEGFEAGRIRQGSFVQWRLTHLGLQAVEAAMQTCPDASPPDPAEMSVRLWNLLRIRRRLTADEAAETLVDAGDGSYPAAKKRIGALLAAWVKHSPKVVATAQKRESGRIRYVLLQDIGRWPPASKAGQVHPARFANVSPMPASYRRSSAASNEVQQ